MRAAFVITAGIFCLTGWWQHDDFWFVVAMFVMWVVIIVDSFMVVKEDKGKAKQ